MAHELEMKNGRACMFYVKERGAPWHFLETKPEALDNPPTSEEGIKAARLDWTVSVKPMECRFEVDGKEKTIRARTRMVVRDSDNKRLSEVGPDWTPLQNIDAFKWFDPFIESGECSLETAGSLFGGERIWVLAKLNRDPMRIVGDDTVNKYLMLANNHSDKRSARIALTNIRVVCNNTMCAAFRDGATKFLSVRHSTNIKNNLEKIREIINTANASFEATAEQYRALTKLQVNQELLKKYIKLVFKQKDKEEEEENSTKDVLENLDESKRKYSVRK